MPLQSLNVLKTYYEQYFKRSHYESCLMLCYFTASDIIVVLRYFMDSATVMAEFRLTWQVIVASPTVSRKFWNKAQLT